MSLVCWVISMSSFFAERYDADIGIQCMGCPDTGGLATKLVDSYSSLTFPAVNHHYCTLDPHGMLMQLIPFSLSNFHPLARCLCPCGLWGMKILLFHYAF
jgi:hypothetical protein